MNATTVASILQPVLLYYIGVVAAALVAWFVKEWPIAEAKAKSTRLETVFRLADTAVAAARQNESLTTKTAMKTAAVAFLVSHGVDEAHADTYIEAAVAGLKQAYGPDPELQAAKVTAPIPDLPAAAERNVVAAVNAIESASVVAAPVAYPTDK